MFFGNYDSHTSMHDLFPLDNYSKGDDACAISHHNIHICGAPPTRADPLHCVQSCFQLKTMLATNMRGFFYVFINFFNAITFKMSPWISRSIWSVRVINDLFGVLIHRWSMTFNVNVCCRPSSHFLWCGQRFLSVRDLSHDCTSNANVHSGWCGLFPLDNLQQKLSMF